MAITGFDPFHKLCEGVLSMPGPEHDASIDRKIERELIPFRQSCLFDNRSRNSYGQTVPPFRELCFILHMDLH